MHPQHDPQAAFHEWFAALVEESGLSIREIEKSTGVGKSTIDAWKNSKALPHSGRDLTKVVRVLLAAAGRNSDDQRLAREWSDLLGKAKEARMHAPGLFPGSPVARLRATPSIVNGGHGPSPRRPRRWKRSAACADRHHAGLGT